jgi:CheY-like chemotaxis protein
LRAARAAHKLALMRLSGLTVLVVEDDIDNLELLGSYLEEEGARVLSAGSIVAALALSLGHHVDAVVSDLELADGDGCALLRQLKLREARTHLPAVAVTGYSENKWHDKATACGFNRFLVKPFSLTTLVQYLEELTRLNAFAPASAAAVGQPCPVVAHPASRGLARR